MRLIKGALEQSNVNAVAEMINIITNARQYEMAVKAMNSAQQMDAAGARLLFFYEISGLGNGGPIALPQFEAIVIGVDGTVSVRPLGQEANTLAQVDRIKLVKPDLEQLIKSDDGLFRLPDGTTAPPDGSVRLIKGALEQSNVNAVAEMINIITNARQYEDGGQGHEQCAADGCGGRAFTQP